MIDSQITISSPVSSMALCDKRETLDSPAMIISLWMVRSAHGMHHRKVSSASSAKRVRRHHHGRARTLCADKGLDAGAVLIELTRRQITARAAIRQKRNCADRRRSTRTMCRQFRAIVCGVSHQSTTVKNCRGILRSAGQTTSAMRRSNTSNNTRSDNTQNAQLRLISSSEYVDPNRFG